MKLFGRGPKEAEGDALVQSFSAPPPGNPIEVGLALRVARESVGISLEQARNATGVPRVDLEALEQGNLEILHVEQAAVVGLWRYSELLGLEPGPLVSVIRAYWPRKSLAVDALYSETGGSGMPVARLSLGNVILERILPKGDDLTQGTAHLGLSDRTRTQLENGSAHNLLEVAVVGPVQKLNGGSAPALSRGRDVDAARPEPPRLSAATAPEAHPVPPESPVPSAQISLAPNSPPRIAPDAVAPDTLTAPVGTRAPGSLATSSPTTPLAGPGPHAPAAPSPPVTPTAPIAPTVPSGSAPSPTPSVPTVPVTPPGSTTPPAPSAPQAPTAPIRPTAPSPSAVPTTPTRPAGPTSPGSAPLPGLTIPIPPPGPTAPTGPRGPVPSVRSLSDPEEEVPTAVAMAAPDRVSYLREGSLWRTPEDPPAPFRDEPPVPLSSNPEVEKAEAHRSRRWSSQLAHVVAERLGLETDEENPDGDASSADPTLRQ